MCPLLQTTHVRWPSCFASTTVRACAKKNMCMCCTLLDAPLCSAWAGRWDDTVISKISFNIKWKSRFKIGKKKRSGQHTTKFWNGITCPEIRWCLGQSLMGFPCFFQMPRYLYHFWGGYILRIRLARRYVAWRHVHVLLHPRQEDKPVWPKGSWVRMGASRWCAWKHQKIGVLDVQFPCERWWWPNRVLLGRTSFSFRIQSSKQGRGVPKYKCLMFACRWKEFFLSAWQSNLCYRRAGENESFWKTWGCEGYANYSYLQNIRAQQ